MVTTSEKIFFSYSRTDASTFALRLAQDLKQKGFDVWIDQEDIRAGSEWDLEIEKALEACDCVLFVETEKSVTSNNVLDEVYYALEQHKRVIPIILVDSKTPFRLQRLQHIDFSKDYNAGLALLVAELESNKAGQQYKPDVAEAAPMPVPPNKKRLSSPVPLLAALLIAAVVITFLLWSKKPGKNQPATELVSSSQSIPENEIPNNTPGNNADVEAAPSTENSQRPQSATENKVARTVPNKPNTAGPTESTVDAGAKLAENFTGSWDLITVEPKAQSSRGYLKIEDAGDQNISIKSYVQFYYPKSSETSYLSVFNAFTGCASCVLQRSIKLSVEDIAIGSRYIRTATQDQTDGKKAGDVVQDISSNKSIRGIANLRFIDSKTAVIKIERADAVDLGNGLTLQPFSYSFSFKRVD